ncbi:inositol monophosphatase SuhB [Gordonia araii NBRC 100433]|uniref:Inositol-1-monophosphatase n=1 Tax=Gordonia araii NBRC 100433 TaxID=1073574 RepID=G7H0I2_9ACTN|nr:inositol monophosphatase family protein [Gordonia araii]GAB09357.1 inositol monophosphatase SuhB [Gordonia araii NBRC 100433]
MAVNDLPAEHASLPAELVEVAVAVAERAAAHVRTRRPELFGAAAPSEDADVVRTKSAPTDPVTIADTEAEAVIRAELARLRPDDAILGEEGGGAREVPTGVRWVVDPIDGTVNFLYGIPAYAVSVAAQLDGRSIAGAVVDVARGATYHAALGGGAFRTDASGAVRLSASAAREPALALVATGFAYAADRRREQAAILSELLPRVRDIRRIGAAAIDLCLVAEGAVDAHYEHGLSPWDWAAGALIAAEAGAVVATPSADSRADAGDVTLAIAPGLADALTAVLSDTGALAALPLPGE